MIVSKSLTMRGVIISIFVQLAVTQAALGSEGIIKNIRNLYSNTNKLISGGSVGKYLLHTGAPNNEATDLKWYRVRGKSGKHDFDKSDYKAVVYLFKGRVVRTDIIESSFNGVFSDKAEYYFYDNGFTAFVFEKYQTLKGYDFGNDRPLPKGPYVVERRTYFDTEGKQIRALLKAYIDSSKKEIPPRYIQYNALDFTYSSKLSKMSFYDEIMKLKKE